MFRKRRAVEPFNEKDSTEITPHVQYPGRINFYSVSPSMDITIDEFEDWAVDRLRVLTELDRVTSVVCKDLEGEMRNILQKYMPLSTNAKARQMEFERKKDHYSHYILRLCFCRKAENRAKFVRHETTLFKLRFESSSQMEKREFINSLPLGLERLTESELLHVPERFKDSQQMYKVDWTLVPDLVSQQKVYLRGGFAYIGESQQASLVVAEFENSLRNSLFQLSRIVGRLNEDDRLLPILDHMSNGFQFDLGVRSNYAVGDGVTAAQLAGFDENNDFPLCMSIMFRTNKKQQHAKHNTRVIFTRFLKHIGLSIDQTLLYWRQYVMSSLSDNKYKPLEYNFRHSYGQVGSRVQYSAPRCADIAGMRPSDTDKCSCPFKSMAVGELRDQLIARGVTAREDLDYVKQSNEQSLYHLSCTRVFERTHNTKVSESITSPNEYFAKAFNQESKATQ